MKKLLKVLALLICIFMLVGCSGGGETAGGDEGGDKPLKIAYSVQ